MYEELVRCLREHAKPWNCADNCICKDATQRGYGSCSDELAKLAADAIEEMSRQRDRAYARLCEWCGVCPEGKRNPEDCEIAALNPSRRRRKHDALHTQTDGAGD